jgi:predicted TIM-barrel fold metal-dependent hydrolase
MRQTLISADSHITEPPNVYVERVDARFRDRAPRLQTGGERGDYFVMGDPLPPIPVGIIAAAGKDPIEIRMDGVKFEDMHKGGWDPIARIADQDRDGISAEIIYPTIGMMLCNHPDFELKRACFKAYNSWIAEFCATSPNRLLGAGQIAMHDPKEAVADLEEIRKLGLRGVMLPGEPAVEDYDSPIYDDFFRACVEMRLPLSFHILTYKGGKPRGSNLNGFMTTIRGCQDILGMLVFGGVFDRHPDLQVVCVEADAGWVPHYLYRMDHGYQRHRHWITPGRELNRKPSTYFSSNIYTTFQDDWSAFGAAKAGMINPDRLLWANDFPHSDSTWPWSQALLAKQALDMPHTLLDKILHRNTAALYDIDLGLIERDKADLDPALVNEMGLEGYNAVGIKNAGRLRDLPSVTEPTNFVLSD